MSKHTHDESWETALGEELGRRVSDVHGAPFTLDEVKGTAVGIRRRRRAVVAGGVLAAAAVILPIAVIASNEDRSQSIQPAGPTPSAATDSADPTPTPPEPENRLGVTYIEGRQLIRADGSTITLPHDYFGGVVLGLDEFVGLRPSPTGDFVLEYVDGTGTVQSSEPTRSSLATNPDGTVVSYLDEEGSLLSVDDYANGVAGGVTTSVDFGRNPELVAVVGDEGCVDRADCVVYLNTAAGPRAVVTGSGEAPEIPDALLQVNGASADGRVVGSTSIQDYGGCNGLFEGARRVFENCDFRYFSFSPDGEYLSGAQAYGDGIGDAWAGIYSAEDGTEITRYQARNEAITHSVWQDADSLLVTSIDFKRITWQVTQLDVDGTQTTVLGPIDADLDNPPFTVLGGS